MNPESIDKAVQQELRLIKENGMYKNNGAWTYGDLDGPREHATYHAGILAGLTRAQQIYEGGEQR